MFVDASAIVAILTREEDADELADVLDAARSPITSPIAIVESTLGVCRKRHASVAEAQEDVSELLKTAGVHAVSITGKEAEAAVVAFSRYGKGRGHPAQLNLGDCFAYAVAKTHRKSMLFKGEDFDKTDIRSATVERYLAAREEAFLRGHVDVVTNSPHAPGCLVVDGSPPADVSDALRGDVAMPSWSIPHAAFDDPDMMGHWVRLAFDAGLRARASKPTRSRQAR